MAKSIIESDCLPLSAGSQKPLTGYLHLKHSSLDLHSNIGESSEGALTLKPAGGGGSGNATVVFERADGDNTKTIIVRTNNDNKNGQLGTSTTPWKKLYVESIDAKNLTLGNGYQQTSASATSIASGSWGTLGGAPIFTGLPIGVYICMVQVTFASNATGRRAIAVSSNDSSSASSQTVNAVSGGATVMNMTRIINNTTDGYTLYARAYHDSGASSLNVTLNTARIIQVG